MADNRSHLLVVRSLHVEYGGGVEALRGVDLSLERGGSLAVVGESGAGKSTLGLCLAGLLQPPVASGSVVLDGHELLGAPEDLLRSLRGSTVAVGLQGTPFNPVVTIGAQIAEPLTHKAGLARTEARLRSENLAEEVELDPDLLRRYPHQLSGGERRLAMLATVLALDPALVVLDEPTAGVDSATKAALIRRIAALADQRGFALVVITHDLVDAARLASQMIVLYAGDVVEAGSTTEVVRHPEHPYSSALVAAYPMMSTTKDLRPIRGQPPDARAVPTGCAFHPRCTQAEPVCAESRPVLAESRGRQVACHFGGLKTLLSAEGLRKAFRSDGRVVEALRGVTLTLREGEALGVIGPSGSGKSTLALILAGHLGADAGEVLLGGDRITTSWRKQARSVRHGIQLVAQDPWDALSPRLTVEQLVREPLDVVRTSDLDGRHQAVTEALSSVGLPGQGAFLSARTHELSGGQLQRVALARALVANPKVLVADEPTVMLDPSEQARLLLVLKERQVEAGAGLVLVSHDMAVVRKVVDRIVVLDDGCVVEEGPSHLVSTRPDSAAARRLVENSPSLDDELGGAPSAQLILRYGSEG